MLLVMDVGNTNTSLGVFDGERLAWHWRLTTEKARTVDEYGVHARNLSRRLMRPRLRRRSQQHQHQQVAHHSPLQFKRRAR